MQTECPGHTEDLGNERDVQVIDGDLGHGDCVHMKGVAVVICLVVDEVVVKRDGMDLTTASCSRERGNVTW